MSDPNWDEPCSSKRRKVVEMATTSKLDENEPVTTSESGESDIPITFVSQYHVVKNIMEYLPFHDVLSSAQVNKQWSEIGRNVRRQRRNTSLIMLFHPYDPEHKLAFEYFNGVKISKEAKELVESGDNGFKAFNLRLYPKANWPELLASMRGALREGLQTAFGEPQMMIGFGTSALYSRIVGGSTTGTQDPDADEHIESMKIIYGQIEERIPCLTSFSCGLIAALPDVENAKSLELERARLPCMSYITIPKVLGLRVKKFVLTEEHCDALTELKPGAAAFGKVFGVAPEEEDNLKGILILHNVNQEVDAVISILSKYLKRNPKVALAGGIHENVCAKGIPDASVALGGFLIFGDESVNVSTVALKDRGMSKRNRAKMDKLKLSLPPKTGSFGFMFACHGRGNKMHGNLNVESDLFNSLLPSTPMLGAFTMGEYCHEVIQPLREAAITAGGIEYSFTTVFMVVSYKHPQIEADSKSAKKA